jgi:hypothetical protein
MLDGAINGDAFLAYVEQFLAPTLAAHAIVADTICNCVQHARDTPGGSIP